MFHGVNDASEHIYGVTVYLCPTNSQRKRKSSLLCNKSHIASLKALRISHLELAAALFLACLVSKVIGVLQVKFSHVYLWPDPMIVLV